MPTGVVVVECYRGLIMIKRGTLQQTSYDFPKKKNTHTHTHNAKWLVPPFYVRNMNTEGRKINYVGLEKQIKRPLD